MGEVEKINHHLKWINVPVPWPSKQAMSDLHDNVQKVEKAAKDGTDMVKALNAAKDSMDTAVSAFCRAVTRA